MEAFDYWYIKEQHKKQHGIEYDLNQKLKDEISKSNLHKEIKDVFKKFKKICGFDLDLIYINNYRPHLNCFFAKIKENKQPIKLSNLGSGYEMIFSLLYSFNISNKIKKDLIILIDEPEIHQHPRLLKKTVDILFKYSKHAQVFITTHSSLFVKYLFQKFGRYYKEDKDNKVKNCIKILKRNNSSDSINDLFLPYFSSNEINYVAFDLVTEEYFNEIYEELKYIYDQKNNKISSYKDFDEKYFIQGKKAKRKHPYKNESESVSIYTYIRNQIHHPKEYKKYGTLKNEKLRKSILNLRKFLRNERKR